MLHDAQFTGLGENWRAFLILEQRGLVSIDVASRQESKASQAGWFWPWQFFGRKRLMVKRMRSSASRFRDACLWGVDLVWASNGNPIPASELAAALKNVDEGKSASGH